MQQFTLRKTGCPLDSGPKLPCQESSRLKKKKQSKTKNKNKTKQKIAVEKNKHVNIFL